MSTGTETDGRSRRWEAHRATRRTELVDAALRAIRAHGAAVGMDEIAAIAGTSKTVVYRHFSDRAGLYAGVLERVTATLDRDLHTALESERWAPGTDDASHRGLVRAAVESYLRLVEEDPEVYRYVVNAPLTPMRENGRDPVAHLNASMAERIASLLAEALTARRLDAVLARTWGYAVVGMVRAAADQWLVDGAARSGLSRAELSDHLADLLWNGLSRSVGDHGG